MAVADPWAAFPDAAPTPDPWAAFPDAGDAWADYPDAGPSPTGPVAEAPAPVDDGSFLSEAAKGLGRGAGTMAGTAVSGLAVLDPSEAVSRDISKYRTDLARIPTMQPEEVEAFRQRIQTEPYIGRRILELTIDDLVSGKMTPEQIMARPEPTPMEERDLYKAGQDISTGAREAMPAAEGWEDSFTALLSEGLGSMGAGALASILAGPAVAGGMFAASGMGESTQRAVEFDKAEKSAGRPGLSDEQMALAGILGVGPGATDLLPVETLLGGLKVPAPFRKPIAAAIGRIGGQAFIEGAQEGGQQFIQNLIAQEVYNPDQNLMEGTGPNISVGAGVGGLAQTGAEAGKSLARLFAGRKAPNVPEAAPQPSETPAEAPVEAPAAEGPGPLELTVPVEVPRPVEDDVEPSAVSVDDLPQNEVSTLRAAGWSDEAIVDMGDEERVAAAEEAQAQGVRVSPTEPPTSAPAAASEVVEEINTPEPEKPAAPAPQPEPVADQQQEVVAKTEVPDVPATPDRPAISTFDPRELKVNPRRFQFRDDTDSEGVTSTLKNVRNWRPERGNQIIVWEAKDGTRYVVDGHQRTGLARRLLSEGKETDIRIPGVLYKEADGISGEDVTTIASTKNIAEGSASPIDAAKVLRTAGKEALEDLPMPKDAVRAAVDLSVLAEEPFRMVINGVVEPNHAKYVGRFLKDDTDRQTAAMKALARAEPANEDEAAVLVRRVAAAELAKDEGSQEDMFGTSPDSTALDEVRIVAGAMRQLRKDKALFAKVAAEADRIEKTGSKIERDAAGKAAQDAEQMSSGLDTLAFRAGPIRDKLKSLASEVKNERRSLAQARAAFVESLRGEAEGPDSSGRGTGKPEREDQDRGKQRPAGAGDSAPNTAAAAKVESRPTASWVIRRKSDGEVLFETYDRKKVKALNTEKYEAVPIQEYLASLNKKPPDRLASTKVEPTTEVVDTADGPREQFVLPGAEKATDADRAQRKADDRLKPKKAQKPADIGLFGDDARQTDLLDLARQKPREPDQGTLFRRNPDTGRPVRSVAELQALQNDLRAIIGRVAGRMKVEFRDRIAVGDAISQEQIDALDRAAARGGGRVLPTVGGYWERGAVPGEDLIALALADPRFDPETTAFHEAWHQIEMVLMTEKERALLKAELPRLKAFAEQEAGRSLDGYPDYEISAIAFQRYGRLKARNADIGGLHIALRRAFDRIAEILRQVRAVLNGRGITRYEDLFEKGYRGDFARRQEGVEAVERSLASVGVAPRTDTPEFKRWFRDSKVVDESGEPLVVYHGTPSPIFGEFSQSKQGKNIDSGFLGAGFYFTDDPVVADYYASTRSTGVGEATYPVFLSIQNPFMWGDKTQGVRGLVMRGDRLPPSIHDELIRRSGFEFDPSAEPDFAAERHLSRLVTEILQEQGFDGVLATARGSKEWVAFSPTQIKSVANRGTFDPDNPNILASSIPHTGQPIAGSFLGDRVDRFKERARIATDPARVLVQDRYLPIKRMQQAIEERTGVKVTTPLDAYQAIRIYVGRAGERLVDLKKNHIEPLVDDLRAKGITGAHLDDYLYARHAPERNAAMAKINPDVGDAGSGMSNEEAAKIIARVKKSGKEADYQALADRVSAIIKATRKELTGSGLIDAKTALQWEQAYPNYVPLRGFDDVAARADDLGVGMPRTGKGFDVRGPESKQALGRRSKADSPLAYAVMQAEQAIVRAEKNRTLKTVLRFAQSEGAQRTGLFKIDRAQMKKRVNPQTGLVETYAIQPHFSNKDNLFAVKIGGKTHWIEIDHPGFARALRGVGSSTDNALMRGLLTVSHIYAKLLTQWNLEFAPVNAVRDVQTALVNVSEFTNLAKGIRTRILKDAFTMKAIRGATAAMYGKDTKNEYAKWFDEFRLAGGKVSFVEINDVEVIKRKIEKSIKAGNTRRGLTALGDLIGNLNTAVENGVRLSVYAKLREAGVPADEAAFIVRDLTTDFNLRGEWGPVINALYIFFNASLQGSMRIARAVGRSKTARRAVGAIFAFGFASEFLNALMGGDDYDEIPEWEFERNLIFMLPGGGYVKFPLAYGYNAPYVAGQQLASVLRGRRDPVEAAMTTSAATMESFNPLGSFGSISQFVAPWFVDPFVQSGENTAWYGGPIMPTVYDDKKPLSETYFRSAPEWAKATARWLNENTGGNQGRPGAIDVSPETLQHYAEFAGGGVGRFLVNSINTAERMLSAEEFLPEDAPFLRRFYSRGDTKAALERKFFDAWDEIDQAHFEQNRLRKDGEAEKARQAADDHRAELRAYNTFNDVQKARKKIRDAKTAAERIADPARRERRIEVLEKQEQAAMEKALDAYRKARGE
ncbi:LPD38 domain-containing protein [Bauldia litoralis]|uniref:LPD38 domain-containing protein n=1 Tax=Bauldia litoralis TaxID=665467 RepID=UPI003266A7EF